MRICHISVVKDTSFYSKIKVILTIPNGLYDETYMASKIKYSPVVINLPIKHAYGLFPKK